MLQVRNQTQFAERPGYSGICTTEQRMPIEGIETTTTPLSWDPFVAQRRIRTGGDTVFSTEYPAMKVVAVVGLPDQRWGERIHAVMRVGAEQSVVPEELRASCRGKVADFNIPKSVET